MKILLTGNPVDGFTVYGPFEAADAIEEGEREDYGDWWIVDEYSGRSTRFPNPCVPGWVVK